MVRSPNPLGDP